MEKGAVGNHWCERVTVRRTCDVDQHATQERHDSCRVCNNVRVCEHPRKSHARHEQHARKEVTCVNVCACVSSLFWVMRTCCSRRSYLPLPNCQTWRWAPAQAIRRLLGLVQASVGIPGQMGIQFCQSWHERITKRNPSASTNDRKMMAALAGAHARRTHYGCPPSWQSA